MANTIISKIAARAKVIRKSNPRMSWQTAIKKASAELKGTTVRTTSKRRVATPRRKKTVGIVSKTKKGTPRKRLTKAEREYNADVDLYKYFIVMVKNGNVQSGWEYKNDAKDALTDYDKGSAKIMTLAQMKKAGIRDPRNEYKHTVGVTKSKTEKISNNPYTFDVKAIRSNGTNVMQKRVVYADNIKQAKINLKEFLAEKLGYKKISITNGRFGHEGIPRSSVLGQATKPVKTKHKDTKSHNVNIRVMSGTKRPKIQKASVDMNALNGVIKFAAGKFYEIVSGANKGSVVKITSIRRPTNKKEGSMLYTSYNVDFYEKRNGVLQKPFKGTITNRWLNKRSIRPRLSVKATEYKKYV
jgi:hypothetical protein